MLECSGTRFCLFKLRAHHCISCCSFYWQSLMHSRVFIWIFIACNRCGYDPDVTALSQPGAPGRHKAGRESLILEVWISQCGPVFLPWDQLATGSKPDGHVQNLPLFHPKSFPEVGPGNVLRLQQSEGWAVQQQPWKCTKKGWKARAGAQPAA